MDKNKQLYDKPLISAGIIIFIIISTFPFWFNLGKAKPAPNPELTEKAKAAKTCVMPASVMRTEHMQILNNWRNLVVREGQRIYVSPNGKQYEISLSNTCQNCHSNKAEFCDRCHNYASARPYCWQCHIENPKEKK